MRGSIRKRGNTWTAYWSTADSATGERRQHSKGGFRTQKLAESHLNAVLAAVDAGSWSTLTKLTLAEFVEKKWIPGLELAVLGGSLKQTTLAFYRDIAKRHIVPNIGGVVLSRLTAVQLNTTYSRLLSTGRSSGEGGLSRTTVASVHRTVHRILRDAVRWGDISTNVATQATAPRKDTKEVKPWTPAETGRFIEATAKDRLGPLWHLAAMTGMRRGEIMGLQWDDVDLDDRHVVIRRTRVMAGGQVVVSTPKTSGSLRTVALDSSTAAALQGYKNRQAEERLKFGAAWANIEGYVFADEVGRPIHPSAISKLFKQAVLATDLPEVTFHHLRHGHATAALEAGASLKVVGDRLGHSSLSVTADIYSHVRPEIDRTLADHVADLVAGAAS